MTQLSTTQLSTIGQIAMIAKDVSRATAFYRDRLGMKFLFEFPGLAFFDCDGVRLMIKVRDIDAAHTDLVAKGVEFTDAPHLIAKLPDHELWMAFFKDSEGNTLALMEERRPKP
jgi:methylmalonyl-CoA/ethylmalonyl-CoA epimerase